MEYLRAYQEPELTTPMENPTVLDLNPDYSFETPSDLSSLPASSRRILTRGLKFKLLDKPKFIRHNFKGLELPGEMEAHINELLKQRVIEEEKNPLCCSPIFAIRKANGKLRLIHDLRNINKCLPQLKCNLPSLKTVSEAIEKKKSKYFCKIDLKNGYFHIPLAQSFKRYICFHFKGTFYKFNKLPFGLSVAPAMFQRMTKSIINSLDKESYLVYLDDFLIMGKTRAECKENCRKLLQRLKELGISVNKGKSILKPTKSLEYLGVKVTARRFKITEDKRKLALTCIDNYDLKLSELERSKILGYLNFYRTNQPGSLAALRLLRNFNIKEPLKCYFQEKTLPFKSKPKVKFTMITDATDHQQAILDPKRNKVKVFRNNLNIFYAELLTILKAIHLGATNIVSDCLPALLTVRKGASFNPIINLLLVKLRVSLTKIKLFYVSTTSNPADFYSRLDLTS